MFAERLRERGLIAISIAMRAIARDAPDPPAPRRATADWFTEYRDNAELNAYLAALAASRSSRRATRRWPACSSSATGSSSMPR